MSAAKSIPIVENYEEVVRRSGLVTPDKLGQLLKSLEYQLGAKPERFQLAQALEAADLVTAWQNSKLMKGCFRGFFLGRYKLLSHLGSGGMSSVYLGEHSLMHRRVAIKVLHQKLTDSPSYLERFYRESRTLSALDHQNIVRAFDIDCEGKHHYLVMEFVEGPTLKDLVEKDGVLAPEKAAEIIQQAAEGLAHAHEAGLIHRDVKPANVMINPKGVIKVLDLGMALTNKQGESLTLKYNEALLGTADFLSPEQAINSHHVDSRADVYSLGCTFFFALTGKPPFGEGSMAQRLMRHQSEPVPKLTALRSDMPEELERIIEKMMAKQAKQRYATMGDVVKALERWVESLSPDAAIKHAFAERLVDEGDDTVNDVTPHTIIGTLSVCEIEEHAKSVGGRAKVRCPVCQNALWAALKSEQVRSTCPSCQSLMLLPSDKHDPNEVLPKVERRDIERRGDIEKAIERQESERRELDLDGSSADISGFHETMGLLAELGEYDIGTAPTKLSSHPETLSDGVTRSELMGETKPAAQAHKPAPKPAQKPQPPAPPQPSAQKQPAPQPPKQQLPVAKLAPQPAKPAQPAAQQPKPRPVVLPAEPLPLPPLPPFPAAAETRAPRPVTGITLGPSEPPRTHRPSEIGEWKFNDFLTALEEGDLRLVEAVITLSVRFPGGNQVGEVLTRLLTAAASLSARSEGQRLDRRLLRAILAALGAVGSQQATLTLGRVVLGYIQLGRHDKLATEAALEALAANLTPEREDFLIDALANAEAARPAGRGDVSPEELRMCVFRLLSKQLTSRARTALRMRLSQPNLHADSRRLIEQMLRK